MLWFLFAILAAVLNAVMNVYAKNLMKKSNSYVTAWARPFFAIPFLVPFLFFVEWPQLSLPFLLAVFSGAVLNVIGQPMQMKALKISPLWKTVPMLNFTPVFLLFLSPMVLGETASYLGLFGVVAVVIGSYMLNVSESHKGFFAPVKALLDDKGSRYMFIVSLLFCFAVMAEKAALSYSNVIFFIVFYYLVISVLHVPVMIYKKLDVVGEVRKHYKEFFVLALITAVIIFFQTYAISIANVSYVSAIKRLSVLFTIVLGHHLFDERNLRDHMFAAFLMVLGVVLISFG
ncbi:MAG: EamA family transporter [Candidatus Aenigmarchaeota archaeon]|nr:EamA family transporter [Candidatus Aenigmarchaeota archaeon]